MPDPEIAEASEVDQPPPRSDEGGAYDVRFLDSLDGIS